VERRRPPLRLRGGATPRPLTFPEGFLWGVGTSSFQIEGALDADGRGPSIWDDFAGEDGDTGAVACDHYRRWREDLDLLLQLGVNAYRFSIAWPRLFPDARRREQRGFDHYDRLVDGLLERGITPVVTLYHWDLPRVLDWADRDTVERFAEYAAACFDAYGDRVDWWITINEHWIVMLLGYQLGLHAPGRKDHRQAVEVAHNLLLAHGRAVQELRPRLPDAKVGIAFALAPHYAESDADEDVRRGSDGYVNRWFLDAALKGSFPDDMHRRWEAVVGPLDFVRDGDLATIAAGNDFVGVNYYARRLMRANPERGPFGWEVVSDPEVPRTDAGTEITPFALTDLLVRLRDDYGDLPILITENGACINDGVHDERRVRFLYGHLTAVHEAIERGVPVVGYTHWSLMDNFEWALGYAQRFGLVDVDYETQRRTIKDSGRYYARIARANALEEPA
jgi:beta-glucosidase